MGDVRTMRASDFKTHCLGLLDRVATTGESIVVTKHGRPVARLVPLVEEQQHGPLHGSVTLLVEDDDAYFSTGEPWHAEEDARRG